MKSTVIYISVWLAATGIAAALALASPTETSVMGQLPAFISRTLAQRPMTVPQDLPSDRTLVLITFNRTQKEQAEGWIEGLNLRGDPSITWMRMPVVNDPGTAQGRDEAQSRLLGRYPRDDERANMLPMFINHENFVRAAGISGTGQMVALIVNRRGEVLARAEGRFEHGKAANLRETLQGRRY